MFFSFTLIRFLNLPSIFDEKSLLRLQSVQNMAIKLVTKKSKFDLVTPLFMELHWLPVADQFQLRLLLLVYQAKNGIAPGYLSDLLTEYTQPRSLCDNVRAKKFSLKPNQRQNIWDHEMHQRSPCTLE